MSEPIERRSYLKYAGVGVVAAVVAGVAGYYAGTASVPPAPVGPGVTTTVTATQTVTKTGEKPKIAPADFMFAGMTDGTKDDGSWGSMCWAAQKKMEELYGCKTSLSESVAWADIEKLYRDYLEEGYHFVMWWGFQGAEAALKVCTEYPKQQTGYTCVTKNGPTASSVVLMEEAPGFITGMLAGFLTKTNKVGAFCGTESPCGNAYVNGYEAGAKYVNPKVEVFKAYAGSWVDPAKGKEAALMMIDAGADFIGKYAAMTDKGAMEACKERNVGTTGIFVPQAFMAPEQDYIDFIMDYMHDYAPVRLMIENLLADGAPMGRQFPAGLCPMFGSVMKAEFLDPFKKLPEDVQKTIKDVCDAALLGTYVPERKEKKTW